MVVIVQTYEWLPLFGWKIDQILLACRLTFGMDYATGQIESEGQCKHFTLQRRDVRNRDSPCACGKKGHQMTGAQHIFQLIPGVFKWFSLPSFRSHSLCAQMQTVKQSTCLQSTKHKKHSHESVISPMAMQLPETKNETLRHPIIGLLKFIDCWCQAQRPASQTSFQTPWKLLKG